MAKTAMIIGGTGQIGLAAARLLASQGWRVVALHRGGGPAPDELSALGVEVRTGDRDKQGELEAALSDGADAVIDCVAFDENHARQLLALQASIGALVVVSSASVYRDAAGRTIDEARHNGFPRFPVPIGEDQPTVAPGPETYSTRKAALEQALLASARIPLAILRAGAIYGAGSRHPREWFFVKRLLDGRTAVPLAFSGKSRFHVAGTANIASIALAAIEAGGIQVLNAADPDAPSVLEIGEAIARVYGSKMELLPFQGPPEGSPGGVGAHPWCIPDPIVLDVSKAQALGWKPGPDYAGSIGEACRSAEALHRAGIAFAPYIDALFDYAAEDAWLAGRAT